MIIKIFNGFEDEAKKLFQVFKILNGQNRDNLGNWKMIKNLPTIDEVTEGSVRVVHLYLVNTVFSAQKLNFFFVMQWIFLYWPWKACIMFGRSMSGSDSSTSSLSFSNASRILCDFSKKKNEIFW